MTMESGPATQRTIEKLSKINHALMQRVERSMDQQGNAYSLFTAAIGLENEVRTRTNELKAALDSLEQSNDALVQARDAAQMANEVKTRFFTAVGHDLLQPLHAARLSLSALGGSDEIEEHKKLATQIDHALSSIEELLKTILDITKLETGAIKANPRPLRLSEIFESLQFDFTPVIKEKKLTMSVSHDNLSVISDPMMLRRILQNLLANAVRYTEAGSISLTAKKDNGHVRISVADTGPGIDPSETKRVFEEFQRGTSARKIGGSGFGLGLSIVERMADALHHKIELVSHVGQGSSFSIIVPFAKMSDPLIEPTLLPAASAAYNFSNITAFVIDNDEPVLEAMTQILAQWSCRVQRARDLSDIDRLIAASGNKPNIAIADYHLDNNVCGLEAITKLRTFFGSELPSIIITADHTAKTASEVEAANCQLLRKPVRPAQLRALMKHLLE